MILRFIILMSVLFGSVQQAAITSGGPTQDFAVSGRFAGGNPKAAIVFGTNGVANGTQVDHGVLSIGLTDGTSQFCVTAKTRDAQSLQSVCDCNGFNDRVFSLYGPTTTSQAGAMALSSFGADKLVGTWSTLPPAAWLVNAFLMGGSDLSCLAGTSATGTVQDVETTVSTSFPVDAIFFISRGITALTGTTQAHARLYLGWAINDNGTIRQGSIAWVDQNGETANKTGARLEDNRALRLLVTGTNPSSEKGVEVSAMSNSLGTGFKHICRDFNGGSNFQFAYLALGFNGALVGTTLRTQPSRTSTGNDVWTTPGHAPQTVFGLFSQLTATNTTDVAADSGAVGLGVMTGASEEFSSAIMSQDAATTSNTKSLTNNIGHDVPQGSGADGTQFDLSSFDSTGATFNYTKVLAAARQQILVDFGRNKVLAKASSTGGMVSLAAGKVAHAGRGRTLTETLERGAPSVAAAGGTARAGRGVTVAGLTAKAQAAVSHAGRVSAVAGTLERGQAKASHAAQARAMAGAIARGVAVAQHAGRGRATPGALALGKASVAHKGKAVSTGGSLIKASAVKSARGRGVTTTGLIARAAPTLAVSGTSWAGRGRTTFGLTAKASARVLHGARAAATFGGAGRAAARAAHAVRARSSVGLVAKAQPKHAAAGRSRAVLGVAERAAAIVRHMLRAQVAFGTIGKAKGIAVHRGTARAELGALARAKAVAVHRARARGLSEFGAHVNFADLPATEIVGFYQRTAKKVRQRLKAVAGSLPIQYANLRFEEPSGSAWARAKVNFGQDIGDVGYGGGFATYIVPGVLQVELRVPIQRGTKGAAELADTLAGQLEKREVSSVIYAMAEVGDARDTGDDEYAVILRVPFRAEDSAFGRSGAIAPLADDFAGSEAQIRARFRSELDDVIVSYDNLPPQTGEIWVRIEVAAAESFNVDGVRRSVGVMIAEIHAPLHSGEKGSLSLADRIVAAFRLVDAGGVVFSVPTVPPAREVLGEWVQPVHCPWSCDHA